MKFLYFDDYLKKEKPVLQQLLYITYINMQCLELGALSKISITFEVH